MTTDSKERFIFGVFPSMAMQMTGQAAFVALNHPRHALFFSMLRKVAPLTLPPPGMGLGVEGVFWAEFISRLPGAAARFVTMSLVIWRKMAAAGRLEGAPAKEEG